jgi:hypothetical protein
MPVLARRGDIARIPGPGMDTIFGARWENLELDDVRRYLEGAEHEPLAWECKGTNLDPRAIRKTACAFGNGNETGYLILGVDEDASGWQLNGYEFSDEPPKWVSLEVVTGRSGPSPALEIYGIERIDRSAVEGAGLAGIEGPPLDVSGWRPSGSVACTPGGAPTCVDRVSRSARRGARY